MSFKACPFCGGNYPKPMGDPKDLSYIQCDLCGARGPIDHDLSRSAEHRWNSRVVYPDYLSYEALKGILSSNLQFHAVLSNCKIYNEPDFIRFYLPHLRIQLKFFDNGTWEIEKDAGPEETH